MATATYDKIATQTLASAASSITFSSIAASWTDLRLVFSLIGTVAGNTVRMQLNGDTASNYSETFMYGDGTTAASSYNTSVTFLTLGVGGTSTFPKLKTLDFFSYAGSTFKSLLLTSSDDQNAAGSYVSRHIQMWRNTSAITSINLYLSGVGQTFAAGTTATLYGIRAAQIMITL